MNSTPNLGTDPRNNSALFDQAARDARRLAERVVAKQKALPPVDDKRTELVQEFRDELRASESWRNDITGEATVGREQRIIKAYLSGDILELGAILNEGLNFEFEDVIKRRHKAWTDDPSNGPEAVNPADYYADPHK